MLVDGFTVAQLSQTNSQQQFTATNHLANTTHIFFSQGLTKLLQH